MRSYTRVTSTSRGNATSSNVFVLVNVNSSYETYSSIESAVIFSFEALNVIKTSPVSLSNAASEENVVPAGIMIPPASSFRITSYNVCYTKLLRL